MLCSKCTDCDSCINEKYINVIGTEFGGYRVFFLVPVLLTYLHVTQQCQQSGLCIQRNPIHMIPIGNAISYQSFTVTK